MRYSIAIRMQTLTVILEDLATDTANYIGALKERRDFRQVQIATRIKNATHSSRLRHIVGCKPLPKE
jgi:hypothetical protein